MNLIQALGWALLHFVWQGAIVGALLATALRLARDSAATVRYGFAVAALAALAFLPVATVARLLDARPGLSTNHAPLEATRPAGVNHLEVPDSKTSESRSASATSPAATLPTSVGTPPPPLPLPLPIAPFVAMQWLQRALPGIVAAWIAGVLALSLRLLGGWLQVQRFRRIAVRPASEECRAMAARLARQLGVHRGVAVLQSAWVTVPAAVGWLRPVLLLPASVLAGLEPRQLELLLAHELAHVRRHDYAVNLLQSILETLLFYHPVTWWVSKQVRTEREHCCDDIALTVCSDARLYARTLLDLETLRTEPEPELALAATGGSLQKRVRRLLHPRRRHADTAPRWAVGTLGLVTALAVAGLMSLAPAGREDVATAAPVAAAKPAPRKHQKPLALHPDPSQPLADRWAWALAQARAHDAPSFWIGYAVAPNPDLGGPVFVGHIEEGEDRIRGQGISLAGRITHIGKHDDHSWIFPGSILDVAAASDAVALLFEVDAAGGGGAAPVIRHAHATSLVYPVNLRSEPIFWIGSAADAASVALVQDEYGRARGLDARVDLTGLLGVHATSSLVVPILSQRLASDAPDDVREEATEWLGRHPRAESLAVLAHAARADRSAQVRREAAESASEMHFPAATDTAIGLANTLRDPDARREAVEALGTKNDAASLQALVEIARHDRNGDLAREAAETLGERPEPEALAALRDLARTNRNEDVRREAVETLGEALSGAEAVGELREIALDNSSREAQREAVETLADLPDERGLATVRELARTHPDPEVRREALEGAGQRLGANEAFDMLLEAVREDTDVDVQREAVETLGQRPERRAHDLVLELAREHRSPQVRAEAVETLGQALPPGEASRVLADLARREPDPDVVREVIDTLVQLPGGAGIQSAVDLARAHPNPEMRHEVLRMLVDSDDPRVQVLFDRALKGH